MSLQQQPAKLQPLSNYIRFTKPKKGAVPKLRHYKPTGYEYETSNLKPRVDEVTGNQNSFIEDSRVSNFTFRASLQIETCLLILSITSFLAEIHFGEYNDLQLQFQANILLMSQSAITLAILILIAIRYKLNLQLRKQQKIESLNATIFHIDYLPYMMIEMALCLVHPTYPSRDVDIVLFEPYDQINIEHQLNDMFALGMLCRVYLIVRALIISTTFSGTRAARLCRVYGCQHNIIFAIKSIMKEIPLRTLAFLFLLMILIYGQGLRISEHNLIKHFPSDFDLSNYSNCFWTIIITMGTVGYGDYFPKTYPGRAIIFLASISGVIMTSLLIITLSDYLSMSTSESKAYLTHQRLKLRTQLQKAALATIKQTSILSHNLYIDDPKIKQSYSGIKQQTARVKMIVRKLQTMMDTDNVSEEMNRLFEILEMSLKEIYQNQLEVYQLLRNLYKQERDSLRALKFSFSAEIQQMIKSN